jgi:predicted cupin superfamily sugar epimerase
MPEALTSGRLIELLGLRPHPTCGYVAETYRSRERIPDEALPTAYAGSRPFGSVLYFMVTGDTPIRLHRIRSDQMYHHYLGAPLEVLLLYPDGAGEIKVIGADLIAGMRPQLLIPGGTFHTSRLQAAQAPTAFALLGTTEWPGFESPDLELAAPEQLIAAYPTLRREITAFTSRRGDMIAGLGRREGDPS